MMEGVRYYRFALFADAPLGKASFSWRLKECLESLGHTVFWFEEGLQPYVFTRHGVVRAYMVRNFFRTQELDAVLLADGLSFDYPRGVSDAANAPVGFVCENAVQAQRVLESLSAYSETGADAGEAVEGVGWLPDFVISTGRSAREVFEQDGRIGAIYDVPPFPDSSFIESELVSPHAGGVGVLCLQDATPERIAFVKKMRIASSDGPLLVRCVGEGWPASWTISHDELHLVYALKRTETVLLFDEDEQLRFDGSNLFVSDHLLGLALGSGARIVSLGGPCVDSMWASYVRMTSEPDLCRSRSEEGERAAVPVDCVLDVAVSELLIDMHEDYSVKGLMEGSAAPRSVVCVMGYIGRSNFANEHILSTIDERMRGQIEGSTVVAISLNPQHSLEVRGIYAISVDNKGVLDVVLARASAVLVVAGLLNDQGMRWGMGQAELLSNVTGCDLSSVASVASLASLNDAQLLFYGAGAGPLDLEDAKNLVSFMGALGVQFVMRDEGSAEYVRSSGVSEAQVHVKADPVLLGKVRQTRRVDEWLVGHELDLDRDRLLAVTLRLGDGLPSDFAKRIAFVLGVVQERFPRVRPVLCLMDPGDSGVVDRVRADMTLPESILVFDPGDDVDALNDLFARSYAGFSMQYYCALVLAREGIPCVSVSNHPKEGALLLADLGCDALSFDGWVTEEELIEALSDVLANRESWSRVVSEGVKRLKGRAQEAQDIVAGLLRERGAVKAFAKKRQLYFHRRSVSDRARDRGEEKLIEKLEAARGERDRAYELAAKRRRWL